MTGLIYVAIVALWAAVLIPMWLRRHDDDQARRIERHRVAMGTLARIADDAESAQGTAARRRRVIVAAAATLGALGTAAWVAGLLPGVVSALLWLPLLGFFPVAFIAERRASRLAAERALDIRRERRADRVARSNPRPAEWPGGSAEPPLSGSPTAAPAAITPRVPDARPSAPAWDEVFDQTA